MITRRQLLKGAVALGVGSASFGGYALAEPYRLNVTRYNLTPPGWPADLALRVAVIADLHVCEPWMNLDRVRRIVARTNAIAPFADEVAHLMTAEDLSAKIVTLNMAGEAVVSSFNIILPRAELLSPLARRFLQLVEAEVEQR